jgi:hypothetical protein
MRIQELDFALVPDAAVVVCIGRRKSGKTVNIIDIFFKKRNAFKYGLVFCGSKATIKQYEQHFPSSFVYYGYHSNVVAAAIDKQEEDVELGKGKPMFILVDDCMWAKKSILNDPNIRRLFMNGRHSLIFFVLSLQYSMDILPSLRQQIDVTFLSREKNPKNRERLYDNYNVCFETQRQFDDCMQKCTRDHETFVLSNCSDTDSDNPEDNVYWWKSKYVETGRRFKVNKYGTWWRYHGEKFNPNHFIRNKEKKLLVTGKKGSGITVTKVVRERTSQPQSQPPYTSKAASWLRIQRMQNEGSRKQAFSGGHKKQHTPHSNIREINSRIKYVNNT